MELQVIWFFLWGLLWAAYFMTDGFDLGVGALYPFLGRDETDKRKMINAIGPLWDGNEVWLITAGGVTFAAFPLVYATMFSSLYTPLMFILFGLIIRGVSFEFRGLSENRLWKKTWDICIFVGSVTPALLFGVAFANIFMGIPIDGKGIFHGNLFTLLNPYGIMGGLLFLLLFMHHGALWLCIRTKEGLQERSIHTAKVLWPVMLVVLAVFVISSWFYTDLYANYLVTPLLFAVPLLAVVAFAGSRIFLAKEKFFPAWGMSSAGIVATTFFGIIGLFPNLFPSSLSPEYSLNIMNSSSSPLTLTIMLWVVVIIVPLVIAYQSWAYYMFRFKVEEEDFTY
ncbi:cytochrome bd-I ubiquinol oxidase subunit 2 apoprotein [Desulfobotulus alkaliphilus]|uniref:Cytochrome bd-I ubiquinol oxidase subunit 2 apoprotein n=1 Tax=Desulfobotulus alkaliphilus TaxID=622671 RepID=A0A562RQR9_9BACT|nr:cytochrome d ubiquinol oxidase subunit II [Desulfobotulus alkaliphilus]TWI70700.1 cytochrome bd-I ubiquinol oxidase subunit 2 apoprotein [Desulfobotulus alkaliphilus]